MARLLIAGSGAFGAAAAQRLAEAGHDVAAAVSPADARKGGTDRLRAWCERSGVPWSDVAVLAPSAVPDGTDAILAAHSHAFIGVRTRARARYALGYHPSMLPLHRGRDAVKWQARLGERVVGGTVYHLTNRVDGGPIALQHALVVPPGLTASQLWHDHLFPLGLELLERAAARVDHDVVDYRPQNDRLATWEPSFDSAPVHRPELLELPAAR